MLLGDDGITTPVSQDDPRAFTMLTDDLKLVDNDKDITITVQTIKNRFFYANSQLGLSSSSIPYVITIIITETPNWVSDFQYCICSHTANPSNYFMSYHLLRLQAKRDKISSTGLFRNHNTSIPIIFNINTVTLPIKFTLFRSTKK